MKKKIAAFISALALVVAFALPAFAASGISKREQALLDKFKAGVVCDDGEQALPPAIYVTQATNWLIKDDLTEEEVQILSDVIDEVYAIAKEKNLHNAAEAKYSSSYSTIVKKIQVAAKKVGYIVEPTTSSNRLADGAYIKNIETGEVIDANTSLVPKQTGFDMTATIVVAVALVAVFGAASVVVGKKHLLAE